MGNTSKWKESLIARTLWKRNSNMMQLVYGQSTSNSKVERDAQGSSESEGDEKEEFFKEKGGSDKVPF